MRWNGWIRAGFGILAPVLFGGLLVAGEWAQSPASAQSDAKPAASEVPKPAAFEAAKPAAAVTTDHSRAAHVRDLQQALTTAGFDPGPIDGIFGPRTKAALRRYIAVPAPNVPGPADKTIAQFRTGEQKVQGQ